MNRWGGDKLIAKGNSTWDNGTGQDTYRDRDMRPNPLGRNKRAVWTITTQPFSESHFAVFPEELCETPIKAGCPEFVCNKCGKPREKILKPTEEYAKFLGQSWHDHSDDAGKGFGQQTRGFSSRKGKVDGIPRYKELGLTDCNCKTSVILA